jgi:hypothetical protein
MTRYNNDWSKTEDDKAWIFSFWQKARLTIKKKFKEYAVHANKSVLCGFGSDLVIGPFPHLSKNSSALAGTVYQYPLHKYELSESIHLEGPDISF